MSKNKILVVDDEAPIRFNLRQFFGIHGYDVVEADTCAKANEVFRSVAPDAVVLDCFLPDGDGVDLIRDFKEVHPAATLIMLTAHESIDLAIRAIKAGAEHFLTKPIDLPALLKILEKELRTQRACRKQTAAQLRQARHATNPFLGTSAAIRKLANEAERVASARAPILICGETGSGKGVLTRWLHQHGSRADEALVDLNCAALSRELLESELFGHARGAFTGAVEAKAGLLEVAHRGTLFLDEIGDMDLQIQPKLLTVLEEQRFRRLGEVRDQQLDVQLIAATHAELEELVRQNKFRSDLYFRISTVSLHVPSLRDRLEDIPPITRALLARLAADLGCGDVGLSGEAEQALQRYSWPGNIRELRNVLERALLISNTNVLQSRDFRFSFRSEAPAANGNGSLTLLEAEKRHIETVLRRENGSVEQAAKVLGLSRSALYERIKKHHISLS